MSGRHSFSVSRAFHQRLSRYAAEHGVSMSRVVERVINKAMDTYVPPMVPDAAPPTPVIRRVYPTPTCTECGAQGHNAAFHRRAVEIEVSKEMYELLSDLRIRAREIDGVEVTRGQLLEQGIERALEAEAGR